MYQFSPRREDGLARLEAFRPFAGSVYSRRRNYDLGPADRGNVSTLSPWIRHRLILEPEAVRAAVATHGERGAETFVQEVVWRTYAKGYLEQHPSVWSSYVRDRDQLLRSLVSDPELSARMERAVTANTGIECFDAWARELLQLGYLHNHARMWFASIWIYTLRLPWQLGADFFLRHLMDGDPAANLLGWRWVCGLHTRGKTYLARPENIEKFTGGRFPWPKGLASSAPALDEDPIGAESVGASGRVPATGDYVLLVTEEDCDPTSLDLPRRPSMVVGCDLDSGWSPLGRAAEPAAFARGAIDDAVARAGREWGVETMRFDRFESMLAWLSRSDRELIVTAWAPVGPVADELARIEPELTMDGTGLTRIRRHWDEIAWPEASRGFFRMKRIIPDLVGQAV